MSYAMEKVCVITFFIVCSLTFLIEGADEDTDRNKDIEQYVEECICESGADPSDAYAWLRNRTYSKSPCFRCFLFCVGIKIGVWRTDGTVDLDGASEHFGSSISREQVAACEALQENNLDFCDKNYQVSTCFDKVIEENALNPKKPIAE
ncbi:uncharacterized protein LOC116180214 [Photinus pyralis]|uniref:uncharacterized protein LOC116180214 n=1 Tax=Photinus pyralis TaxID=7054 RepID=UPI0012677BD8|nr:uncharacterized protein LOC116180214 [Photinus pyralis]